MNNFDEYNRPLKIAEGIYWVGFYDETSNFHCNPYLLIESDQAVLIDGGSRPDFAVVMSKILQTGIHPKQIVALIYQHYDPDLCGSMLNLIDTCENDNLKIISEQDNYNFIHYYVGKDKHHMIEQIDKIGFRLVFNGRELQFLKTPYAHSPGSFISYDTKTKTLFSSDLFGSFSKKWDLFIELSESCPICIDYNNCIKGKDYCPLPDFIDFHKKIMPSAKSLKHAMNIIKSLDVNMIAPQHGSVIKNRDDADFLIKILESLEDVGIDGISQRI